MIKIRTAHTPMLLLALLVFLMVSCSSEDTSTVLELENSETATPSESTTVSDLLPHQKMSKDFLRELIAIDTTHSTGNTTNAANAMAAHIDARRDAVLSEFYPDAATT